MAQKQINIRNYTSEADPGLSQLKIEQMILTHGGRNITKIYDDNQNCISIGFILPTNGMQTPFLLEANVELVYQYMIKQYDRTPTSVQIAAIRKQASRTAWKNLMELLQIQLDMVKINQVELMQVLLPIVSNGKETFYESLKKTKFKALTE